MRRRNGSDERLQEALRRVKAGDMDALLEAARIYERSLGLGKPRLHPELVREITQNFEQLEQVADENAGPYDVRDAFFDADDYPDFDSEEHANYAIGYLRGVMHALELDVHQIWEISEKARDGEGQKRIERVTPAWCDSCDDFPRPENVSDAHEPGCSVQGAVCSLHHGCDEGEDDNDESSYDSGDEDDGNAGCDRCGSADRVEGSRYCEGCIDDGGRS